MSEDQSTVSDVAVSTDPEGLVPEMSLADHLDGYWASSKNVSQ